MLAITVESTLMLLGISLSAHGIDIPLTGNDFNKSTIFSVMCSYDINPTSDKSPTNSILEIKNLIPRKLLNFWSWWEHNKHLLNPFQI